ncbi:MAG: biosynthetic peptidoglycan transglycosylase [Burkholderiaceae bacterium]
MKRFFLKCAAISCIVLCMALVALTVAAVDAFTPAQGEWTKPLRVGGQRIGFTLDVSVPAVLRTAMHPRVGPWLHGRHIHTRYGQVELGWRASTQSLHLLCAPCTFNRPELSRAAIVLEAVELSVQRTDKNQLRGAVFAGNVRVMWQGRLSAKALTIDAQLPQTPLADLFALAADAVPEARQAQIDGTASATATLQLPSGAWSVKPQVDGFSVSGLGTEALANAKWPAQCGSVPRKRAKPAVWMERAVIAAEDQRFWEHPGYDLAEILASLAVNKANADVERGGSTLTQQLAKLVFTGDDRTHTRKLRELLFAVEMERTLGKGRILQLYMALAPWGEGVCGASAAAQHYLHKQVSELDAVEAAWLAGMLRSPGSAALKLRAHGQIDVKRTQTVIAALRPARREKREDWAVLAQTWLPASADSSASSTSNLSASAPQAPQTNIQPAESTVAPSLSAAVLSNQP